MAAVYVYELPDGSKLITDQRKSNSEYKLKNTYKTTPYGSSSRRNKPYYASTIKSQYDALIVNTALKYDLEPSFIKAVIHIESAFDRHAVSHAGAMGLMQLMPATARSYDLNNNFFEPRKNMNAGIAHLKYLMERYDDNTTLSLAAYNAGEGAVARYDGIPPYKETQNYVTKVLKLYGKYQESFTG